jgi:IS5 family transposase
MLIVRAIKMKPTMFGTEINLEILRKKNDTLLKMKNSIDWEMFRPIIKVIRKDRKLGGRPPYDDILMFKIIVLQEMYNLSDDAIETQILDRLSFNDFLDLCVGEKIPDANTIWEFKEALKDFEIDRILFDKFNEMLEIKGIISHKGTIIDATFVTAPKRHTTQNDNDHLKKGEELEDLPRKCKERIASGEIKDTKNVYSQTDLDARWTKKNDESYFGYKDHVKCDSDSKVITDFSVTPASVHDSQEFVKFIDDRDNVVMADSGYVGETYAQEIQKAHPNVILKICARPYRNTPLSDADKKRNTSIAKIRGRIEHIFGYMTRFMGGLTIRVHGKERVAREITMKNLVYNMRRYMLLAG